MRGTTAVLVACLFVLALAGIAAAAPEDTWRITSPANGSTVTGPDVTITLDPGEMKIVPPGGPVTAGEGHWHFFVDGNEVGKGPMNSFTYTGLSVGSHVLRVELHHNDHTLYAYGSADEVTVTVGLPKTGGNVLLYTALGAGLIGIGLLLRRRDLTGVA